MADKKLDLSAFDDDAPAQAPTKLDLSAFDDTAPPSPASPVADTKTFFDTGSRVTKEQLEGLAKKYNMPLEDLEKQAIRKGATYPGSTEGERAAASLYKLGDNMAFNLPSWFIKKSWNEPGEAAIDELNSQIEGSKTLKQKVLDFSQGMAAPANVLVKSAEPVVDAIKGGALIGGLVGLTGSKDDEEIKSAVHGAGAGTIAGPLAQKGLEYGARGVSKIFGRGGDVAVPYLKNPDKYNDPDLNFENVQKSVDNPLHKILGDISAAKEGEGVARQSARDATKAAQVSADRARAEYIQSLRDTKIPDDAPDVVREALRAQQQRVNEGFSAQVQELEKSGKKVSLQPLADYLDQELERRKVEGMFLPDDPEVAMIQKYRKAVTALQERNADSAASDTHLTDQFGAPLPTSAQPPTPSDNLVSPTSLRDLRRYISDINSAAYNMPLGGHTSPGQRVGKGANAEINRILDTELPNSDAAKAARAKLANDSKLAEAASDEFGGDYLQGKLASLAHANNREKLALLNQLDMATGGKIKSRLKAYMDAQAQLGNKVTLEDAISKLPEVLNADKIAKKGEGDVTAALANTERAKAVHDSVDNMTPDNSQAAIRRMLFSNDRKPEVRTKEAFDRLGELSGEDYAGRINDLKVKTAFSGGTPNGSRLVQLGGTVGQAIAGKPGEVVGKVAAGLADYSTGKLAKWALDASIKTREPVTRAAGLLVGKLLPRLESDRSPKARQVVALLENATQRGPQAVLATHAMLSRDPEYQALIVEPEESVP